MRLDEMHDYEYYERQRLAIWQAEANELPDIRLEQWHTSFKNPSHGYDDRWVAMVEEQRVLRTGINEAFEVTT
jgi:hypothetical protein